MGSGSFARSEFARQVWRVALAVPLALAAVVGCAGPARNAPPEPLAVKVWSNRGPADDYHDADADAVNGLERVMSGRPPDLPDDKPLNVLCVSGGGKYAAFTAGVLCGWTASGTRPTLDVATGVSSGAPVAFLAFLGPKYDELLTNTFLNIRRPDLYVWRPVRGIATGTGLMSARPLTQLLDRRLDDAVLADLRAAHASGRRLFIATSNVRTHRLAVWDVGAIACSGRPDAAALVRKVVLAACSIPGIVPPVEFDVTVNGVRYKELHADAGNLAQVFVSTTKPLAPGSAIWILSAGKSHLDATDGTPRIIGSMLTAVSATLYALFRADTVKLYALCGVTRSRFRLMALPASFNGKSSSMQFDPEEARRMYWIGYQMATGDAWETKPPDTAPGDVALPRAGTDFVAPQ